MVSLTRLQRSSEQPNGRERERERKKVSRGRGSFFLFAEWFDGSIYGIRIFVFWTEVREKDRGRIFYNWADENRSF